MAHPLTNHENWKYWQPFLGAVSTVMVVKSEKEDEIVKIGASGACREVIIALMRSSIQRRVRAAPKSSAPGRGLKTAPRIASVRLYDPRLLENLPGANYLKTHPSAIKKSRLAKEEPSQEEIETFLLVCDAICGIPSVLLAHRRPTGDWWRSSPELIAQEIHWNGADNWFVRHPALVGLATGLFRQAAMLTAGGFAPQILETVERAKVEEALTTADQKLAYELVKKLRTWIEVPCAGGASVINYPVPLGYWKVFDCLQRAQQRHNYREIFGTDFYGSWGLEGPGAALPYYHQYNGAFSFWGQRTAPTAALRHLLELGKPHRRTRSAQKVLSANS